ncbi:MAG TPA: cupin domain-containing protein [Candidatus Acidoferrum sp.]|nr:cupin domain-containing protein [Candidatus Acidoferrum sp.]
MSESTAHVVSAGQDRFGEKHSIGNNFSRIKVGTADTGGRLFVAENVLNQKLGPPRHLHYDQDEWFLVLEGKFLFEVGDQKFTLQPGDSLLGPRRVPHVWAFTGDETGRLLVTFAPAGKVEAFFREVSSPGGRPPSDPKLWSEHGMELLGPPLLAPLLV